MKISVAHINHGLDGVGVGVRGCCSILTLELGALVDYFFNGLVYAMSEETSMHEQL